jgi:hypothetical protein
MTASGANKAQIKFDLNYPAFQKELFSLDANEIKKLFKTFAKLSKMSWDHCLLTTG